MLGGRWRGEERHDGEEGRTCEQCKDVIDTAGKEGRMGDVHAREGS